MFVHNYFLFPLIFAIGTITTIEDHSTGKIRNIWILSGLLIGSLFYLFLMFFEVVRHDLLIQNFFVSTLASYAMWKSKCWNPGDAKLFIIYAFLTPPHIYNKVYFYSFPAFNLLVNIFVPAMIFLFIISLKDVILKEAKTFFLSISKRIKEKNNLTYERHYLSNYLKNNFAFFCIFLFRKLLNEKVNSLFILDKKIIFLLLFLVYRPLAKFLVKKIHLVLLASLILVFSFIPRIASDPQAAFSSIINSFTVSVTLILFFNLFSMFIFLHIKHSGNESIPFAGWMFLGVIITWFLPDCFLNIYKSILPF